MSGTNRNQRVVSEDLATLVARDISVLKPGEPSFRSLERRPAETPCRLHVHPTVVNENDFLRAHHNSTKFSVPFSGGAAIWATLLVSTARSSTAFVAKPDLKPYTNSSCTDRKSSFTSATRCICGSGMFESWIFRTVLKPTMCPFAWMAGALRHPNLAGVRLDIG